MRLILRVLSYKGLPLSDAMEVEFTELGGSIGRKPGNTMVLPDSEQIVSGRHAEITFGNNGFTIKDDSTNGTVLVNGGIELKHASAPLKDTEIIRIGEYELGVQIVGELPVEKNFRVEATPASLPDFADPFIPAFTSGSAIKSASVQNLPEVLPLFAELDSFAQQESPSLGQPIFKEAAPSSAFQDSFVPPNVSAVGYGDNDIAQFLKGLDAIDSAAQATEIPEIIEFPAPASFPEVTEKGLSHEVPVVDQSGLASSNADFVKLEPISPVEPAVAQPNPTLVGNPQPGDELIRQFLLGAGIGEAGFLSDESWPEAMHTIGNLFRTMVEGLMEVLRARAEMKSEFRVSVTTLRSFDNNPLKFNPDVESVLKLLITDKNPAFVDADTAVKEAFKDIKFHQLAMTAGIQASVAGILARFNPDGIEQQLGEGLIFQKKSRCWEVYCERYPKLKNLAMDGFFGDEFAEAYEKQMLLLSKRQN